MPWPRTSGRYLADEPVQACPPTVGYRGHTWRNKVVLGVCSVILTAVVVGPGALGGGPRPVGETDGDESTRGSGRGE